jgi:membrane fusion protein (multidrug efflux system)
MRFRAIALAFLFVTGVAACDQSVEEEADAASAPPPSVGIAPVVRREVTPSLEFVARIEAINAVDLEARVSGFLIERLVRDGAVVEAGELLFRIEPEPYEAAVAARRAEVASTEAIFENARLRRERMEELVAREAQPQANLDEAIALEGEAKAAIDAAKAALDKAEIDLGYTEITAPFAGRIGRLEFSEGAIVGPDRGPIARLVQLDPVFATIPVNDRTMLAFRRSQQDGSGAKPFLRLADGTMMENAGEFDFFEPQVSETTSTVAVRATFANPDNVLLPGQFVTAVVRSAEPEMALTIPQIAVQQDQSGRFVLTVDANNVVQETRVELGDRVETDWVVEGGLEEGQNVIVEGLQKARSGATVAPAPASLADMAS